MDWRSFDLTPYKNNMSANSTIEEIKSELAKLQAEHEILAKSHRRLVAKVLDDRTATAQFLGQMAVDRMMVYPR